MARQGKQSIEEQAENLLDEVGITTYPVSVERIAKYLGAQLRYSPLDEQLSGMVYIKDGVAIIGVNALHHPHRQRFSIAHEIGHLCLHKEHLSDTVHVDKDFRVSVLNRDANSATGTEKREIEANQFGAAVLVPRKMLNELLSTMRSDIDNQDALESCAKKFKVSKAMLEYRIRNLSNDNTGGAS